MLPHGLARLGFHMNDVGFYVLGWIQRVCLYVSMSALRARRLLRSLLSTGEYVFRVLLDAYLLPGTAKHVPAVLL